MGVPASAKATAGPPKLVTSPRAKAGGPHADRIMTILQLRRALNFRDLFLFYIVTGFSLRWIATAAAAGPSALVIWAIAALGLFVPLVFSVLELSSRYPEEGGVYVWSKGAFGAFAAFVSGWTCWGSGLPGSPRLASSAPVNA